MRTAYIISGIGHATVLLLSVLSLTARPLPVPPGEALPVDIVSVSEFTQMTAGNKNAAQTESKQPKVEKVAEAKPVEDLTGKVVEKNEVKAAREAAPAPEAKPVESKPEQKPEQKPTQAAPKPDPIAETLAKEEAKKLEPKTAEAKPPTPPKKPAPPAPKFDPNHVEALLNKRDPTRLAAAGPAIIEEAPTGDAKGQAPQLSMSELDALRQRLAGLWNPPAGAKNVQELVSVFRIKLRPDGTIMPGFPQLVSTGGDTALAMAARESAARALNRGQPYTMLKPEHYEQWKDIEITFDPRDMLGY
jgi:outer membrane biosynthesis protein TonB